MTTSQASRVVPAKPIVDAHITAWGLVIRPDGSGLSLVLFIIASFLTSNTWGPKKSNKITFQQRWCGNLVTKMPHIFWSKCFIIRTNAVLYIHLGLGRTLRQNRAFNVIYSLNSAGIRLLLIKIVIQYYEHFSLIVTLHTLISIWHYVYTVNVISTKFHGT